MYKYSTNYQFNGMQGIKLNFFFLITPIPPPLDFFGWKVVNIRFNVT